MSWYNSNESSNPYILWSRVRYLRSLAALPFSPRHSEAVSYEYEKQDERLEKIMSDNGFHKQALTDNERTDALSLAEKQLVSAAFTRAGENRALYFNEPCSLAIYTDAESYITIQALLGGAAFYEAHKIASEAEELLDGEFAFAFSANTTVVLPSTIPLYAPPMI